MKTPAERLDDAITTPPASGEAAVLAWLIVYRGRVIGYATHDSKPHVRLAEDETLVPVAAVAPAGMDGWQPIETVPRDGRPVVVWTHDGRFSSASYNAHSEPQATHWMIPTPPATAGKGWTVT